MRTLTAMLMIAAMAAAPAAAQTQDIEFAKQQIKLLEDAGIDASDMRRTLAKMEAEHRARTAPPPAAAPVAASPQAKAELIDYKGKPVYGVREVPGYQITGTYLYERRGEPRVELNADGSGCWANHGRPCTRITWWVQSDDKGTAFVNDSEPQILRYALFFRHEEPADAKQPGDFSGHTLFVNKAAGNINIAGERFKALTAR